MCRHGFSPDKLLLCVSEKQENKIYENMISTEIFSGLRSNTYNTNTIHVLYNINTKLEQNTGVVNENKCLSSVWIEDLILII